MTVRKQAMTGLERARQRRQRRTMAILAIAAVMVCGGFVMSIGYVEGWFGGSSTSAKPTCTPPPPPAHAKFTVNVYNSSKRSGAATDLSKALRSRDFSLGDVGNDPYKKKLADGGEIRYGSEGEALAKQHIVPLLPGATLIRDGRDGTSVDVAIGENTASVAESTQPPKENNC